MDGVDMFDAVLAGPPSLLLSGDPGPFPWPPDEPPCWAGCGCTDEPRPPGSSAPADPAVDWALPGVPRPAGGPAPVLGRLAGLVDELAAHGPLSGSRADVSGLLRQVERLRALALRELAEMDAVAGHARPGTTSTTASWLREVRNLSDGAARATVTLALALRDDLPFLHELLLTGTISLEHAAAVRDGLRGLDRDLVTDAADGISQLARCTDPVDLRRRLRDKAHAIDDRLAADAERRARARMGLRLSDVGSHTAIDGTLPAEDGAIVRLAMDLAAEADRTTQDQQTEQTGHTGRSGADRRSTAARHADVLIRWASDYLHRTHGPGDSLADDAHTVRTHLHVLCRPDQLTSSPDRTAAADARRGSSLAELIQHDLHGAPPAAPSIAGDLGTLSRQALRRLACDATLDLITLSPLVRPHLDGPQTTGPGRDAHRLSPSGTSSSPLDVGRSRRTVTGKLFRALITRDRHCTVKGCRRRPAQCAAHHVQHWADGGPTDLHNLVLLCHQHHHDHHDRGHDLPHHDGHRWLTQTGWRLAPP